MSLSATIKHVLNYRNSGRENVLEPKNSGLQSRLYLEHMNSLDRSSDLCCCVLITQSMFENLLSEGIHLFKPSKIGITTLNVCLHPQSRKISGAKGKAFSGKFILERCHVYS